MSDEEGNAIRVLPTREAWLLARREGIGGSDAAAVLGLSPWKSALEVYCEKLGIAEPTEETEAMKLGLLLEPVVALLYGEATGRAVIDPGPYTIRASAKYPFMRASLDRLVHDPARGPGVLQIKTASAYKAEEWEHEPPRHYQIQLQHEIEVAGVEWGSLAVLLGGQRFLYADMVRLPEFVTELVAAEAAFWHRVVTQNPPPPNAPADRKALAALYPKDTGEIKELPEAAEEWDRQRLAAIERIREAEAEKTVAENALKAAIGEASIGTLANRFQYSWSLVERAGYTVEPTSFRQLRRKVL